jgi:hypothetical protein
VRNSSCPGGGNQEERHRGKGEEHIKHVQQEAIWKNLTGEQERNISKMYMRRQ